MNMTSFRAALTALALALAPLTLLACPGDMDDTTATTLPTSTAPPLTIDTDTSGNTPTTSDEPETCVDPDVVCDRLVTNATDFCDAIAQFGATRSIEEPYIGFVVAKCEANEPKCDVCFELENYCVQIGEACDGLKSLCACVGEAFGVP